MDNDQAFQDFLLLLHEEVGEMKIHRELPILDAFTDYMIAILNEAGELEDGYTCYHKARGIEINGYGLEDDGTLNLFRSTYTGDIPVSHLGKNDTETSFKRLAAFLQKCFDQYYTTFGETSPVYDMAETIYQAKGEITRVRLFLFTDCLVNAIELPDIEIETIPITCHIWDVQRLYRYHSSGKSAEPIEIEFENPLPCLEGTNGAGDYTAYLTVFPAEILSKLYATYGTRLLELNIRSYLQARGKINKGIQQTIRNNPDRFLAYNNGISATASHIGLEVLPGGGLGIRSLSNLQIVNGGQTTASIYYTAHKYKIDISRVRIQTKISVVNDAQKDEMVPLISRYANSQNKVNEADFNANDPFHVRLESLSRTIWASPREGFQQQTRWFYERARGQYQDALAREVTAAKQRQFKEAHPMAQKFTKTDLAKYELTWNQQPHVVSYGAQKCFVKFSEQLAKRGTFEVNYPYFTHLVAKAILFKQAEAIVSDLKFGGYRANVVTYTLAYLSHYTESRIDLTLIWKQQAIGPGLAEAIHLVAPRVHEIITAPPDGKNVTEWCKREACWISVKSLAIILPEQLNNEKINRKQVPGDRGFADLDTEEQQQITQIASIPASTWRQLASWARETDNLEHWERRLAADLENIYNRGKSPSIRQTQQGIAMLKEAQRLGFKDDGTAQ